MNCDVIIVGAGLAGSVCARFFAERNFKVIIIERLKHLAGHCHDYKNEYGLTVHTYGPHIFHTSIKPVWEFVNRFAKFNTYQHRVLSYADGRYYPFPINRDTLNEVFGINLGVDDIYPFLQEQIKKSTYHEPVKNFRDAVISQVGENLYKLFFKNYTQKQWQRNPEDLSADLARRIPVRTNSDDRYFTDKYQGLPIHGYTKMIENMLDHDNISYLLGVDYFPIKNDIKANLTVYTGELDRFFDYKYGKLEYRSLDLIFETFDKEWYQKAAVVNYPNDYDWTRITEFKYMTLEKSNKTTVCFEYPKETGGPFYVVLDDNNTSRRNLYLKESTELEKGMNYLFIGRLAEYKYYNMDQVISAALEKAASWVQKID